MFCPLDPKQSQDRVFKFKLSHRSFACWQAVSDLCEFGGHFCGGPAIQRVHEWRPPKFSPQFTQVAWASAGRLITHLIPYIKSVIAMGSDVTVLLLILQHSVWSWSLWCFYMLFNCYFKECFNAKGRTKKSWHWFFEIVFTWISKITYQDESIMLHAIYHVIHVWYNFSRP